MAWIESHQSLSRHRKTLAVVAELKVDRHKLIGHLHELWWWGLDNATVSGALGRSISNEVLAEAAGWPIRDAERFVGALVSAGFLDATETGRVFHDWEDYAGKLIDRRAANRDRMRNARAEHVQRTDTTRAEKVAHVVHARVELPDPTQPDTTIIPPKPPSGGGRQSVPKPKRERTVITDQDTEALVEKYAVRYGSPQAVRDEIELALNHQARLKNFNERLYVDGWLRREIEHRPGFRAANGRTAAVAAPHHVIDRTGVEN